MMVERSGFSGRRLLEAREARGISRTELARQLGVSKQAVSQYEKGQRSPSGDVLFGMARNLGVPLHFFMERKAAQVTGTVFFRSMAAATKNAREGAKRKYVWAKDLVRYLREFIEFPRVNFPSSSVPADPVALTDEDIERIATETRRFWGLGDGPISNVTWLLENNGAIVIRQDFDVKTLDAFSEWDVEDHTPYFVLGVGKTSAARSRLDAAHELGHMILHRHAKSIGSATFRLIEDQAYRFAGAFLLPAPSFRVEVMPTFRSLLLAKAKWRVSVAAMIKRMANLGLISPIREQRLFANLSRRGWRTKEPLDDELEMEEPRLIKRSLDLLSANGMVRPDDLKARLGLYIEDIENVTGLPGYFAQGPESPEFPKIIRFDQGVKDSEDKQREDPNR
jgi:Zn-dependent peptidase ImmA (M78 family)/transcriptional regulator with XRE-family HTH domain